MRWSVWDSQLYALIGVGVFNVAHPRFGLANSCFVGEGTAVPVDEAEDESSSSSWPVSWRGSIEEPPSRIRGASGGSLASFAFANDF